MDQNKRAEKAVVGSVRRTDLEPYTALRWLGTLFKSAAVFLAIALIGEVMAGIRFEGAQALPILLGEAARTFVLAVVLWGAGDLVRLLITVGNDVRAERILMARLVYRTPVHKDEMIAAGEVEAATADLPQSIMNPAIHDAA
jgi:hypothetical protein